MRFGMPSDVPAVMRALAALQEKAAGRGQMAYADLTKAEASVWTAINEGRTRVVHGYFIMFDVGNPWYSYDSFLIEDIILKIERTDSPVEVAIDALEVLAKVYGCSAVAAGDTQVGYMTPKYINKGYAVLGTQLFKGVPDGIRPKGHGGAGSD